MKPVSALLAFVFFLLFAFTTTTAKPVYDSDGKPLLNGGEYYLSSPDPNGGVIFSAAIRKGTTTECSLAVISALNKPAWSTIISTPYRIQYMSTTFPLDISFAHLPPNICTETSHWLVVESESLGRTVMVGDEEEFGEALVRGWFQIQPYDSKYYKLIFCTSTIDCGDIGVHVDDNKNRLVVTTENPLIFKFVKVKQCSPSGISMAE